MNEAEDCSDMHEYNPSLIGDFLFIGWMDTVGYHFVQPTSDSHMAEWGRLLLYREWTGSTHSSQNGRSNADCSLYTSRYWVDLAQQWLLEPIQSLCQGHANENKVSQGTLAGSDFVAIGRRYNLSLVRASSCL